MHFKQEVISDLYAIDEAGHQHHSDESGEEIGAGPDNELIGAVVRVIWNDYHATISKYCAQGRTMNRTVRTSVPTRVNVYLFSKPRSPLRASSLGQQT
jgi:hypothetical protein